MREPIFARGNCRTLRRLKRLRREAQTDGAVRVALRIQAVMLSLKKYTCGQIAQLLHVARSRVHEWITRWNAYGDEGLLEGHRSGRPQRLRAPQLERLADIVDSGPVAYGLSTGVWTSPIIAQVIDEEFAVRYHPGHVRKVLKQLEFSVQRPTTQLARAQTPARNRWVRYTYPDLKKKRAKRAD